MQDKVNRLGDLFSAMVAHYNTMGDAWKNIPLGREAFELMRALPDVLPGEYETAAEKAHLLEQMLEQMEETTTPRLCIEVREYMQSLDPTNEDNVEQLQKLRDFIDPALSVQEYCQRHHRMLRFDPVERSPEFEAAIYDATREAVESVSDMPRGMGFCFAYWPALAAALSRRGVEWRSPQQMNPGVLFD